MRTLPIALMLAAALIPAASADVQGQLCNDPLAGTCVSQGDGTTCDVTYIGTIWVGVWIQLPDEVYVASARLR